jgi:aspartyl-tRNA(Asn)/glutamyl-tRNA(Gln) amidotransferase subunit B
MELEAIIGLEVHVQLTTKSKMFCSCANVFGDVEPNSAICPICLGYPGTLPVPNRQAIEWAQLVGAALNCELAQESKFDRKSYFYPDLPKGYQISQYDKPFCGKGEMRIIVGEEERAIGITRAHLEEDAAKNIHPPRAKHTLIDFNRAGTPLVEIVTEPDLRSPAEAKVFLQELQRIMRVLGVSDADMEKGQLRCDANISLREVGSKKLNPKIEVKNLNSFRNVEKALAFEIDRQTKEFNKGTIPRPATRGFDAAQGVTVAQRTKEEAADYRYFPEPDIPPFAFATQELEERRLAVPELPHDKRERLMRQTSISREQAQLLADMPKLADFYEQTVSELQQLDKEQADIAADEIKALVQRAANVILRDVRAMAAGESKSLAITPANFAELVVLLHQGKLNPSAVPKVLAEMQKTGGDPDHILRNLGLEQVSDAAELERVIDEVIASNEDVVAKIKAGKDSALQALVGQVMQKTRGKANPKLAADLLKQKILGLRK